MNETTDASTLLIAVDLCSRGFGFAVMEGLDYLVDWGLKEAKSDKNACCLRYLASLLKGYQPDILVVEDYSAKGLHRCRRVRKLMQEVLRLAYKHGIRTRCISQSAVRTVFLERQASGKHQIATVIGNMYPELIPRIPPERKCWMSEDPRSNIFDAAALGITYLYNKNNRKRSD